MTIDSEARHPYTLIEIDVAGVAFRFINDTAELVSGGNTFLPASFAAPIMAQPSEGFPTAQIQFSNLLPSDQPSEFGEMIFSAGENIIGSTLVHRTVFRSSPDAYLTESSIVVQKITITPTAVVFTVGYFNPYDHSIPRDYYDSETAPGLAH